MLAVEDGTLKGLRRERKNAGLSQVRLSHLAGTSYNTVQRAEYGEPVGTRTLAKLANALGVSASALMEDER